MENKRFTYGLMFFALTMAIQVGSQLILVDIFGNNFIMWILLPIWPPFYAKCLRYMSDSKPTKMDHFIFWAYKYISTVLFPHLGCEQGFRKDWMTWSQYKGMTGNLSRKLIVGH